MTSYKKWIKAEEGSSNSVIYYDEDGNKLTRFWKAYEGQLKTVCHIHGEYRARKIDIQQRNRD
jgi:hypothetical protein